VRVNPAGWSKFVSDVVRSNVRRSGLASFGRGAWIRSISHVSSGSGMAYCALALERPRTRTSARVRRLRMGFLPLGRCGIMFSLSAVVATLVGGTGDAELKRGPYSQVTSLSLSLVGGVLADVH